MVPYIVDQKIILDSIAASTEVLIRFSFDATHCDQGCNGIFWNRALSSEPKRDTSNVGIRDMN
eukprot:CCRYP_014466-RB/>CCRYP_014466-RB protein AED:0.32 eAED:0.37 QI:955/0.5/0.66/1/0/0/3/0/62